jgi:hypothetical protein
MVFSSQGGYSGDLAFDWVKG